MERGEVWWANLPNPVGPGPGYRRTVVVVAIAGNIALGGAPGNVTVTSRYSGLPKDSVINVSQVLTIDRVLLGEYAGSIPA
jgi:mRNA interferase MazF